MTSVRRPLLAAVGSALALVLVGCGSDPGAADDPTPAPAPTETTVPPTPTPPASPSATPSGPVAQAVADLAGSLGIDAADVEVVSMEEVTWRDGSRGCAQPGMAYTQALIDGSRITLRVAGKTYEYHSGGSQPPSLCDSPTE